MQYSRIIWCQLAKEKNDLPRGIRAASKGLLRSTCAAAIKGSQVKDACSTNVYNSLGLRWQGQNHKIAAEPVMAIKMASSMSSSASLAFTYYSQPV
jgi:hypothetical protein